MPNTWLSVELERYKKMDDWVYTRHICEDCRRIQGEDFKLSKGNRYIDSFQPCDGGPWCPDNDLPGVYDDKT